MRILASFHHRDNWYLACTAADARTPISGRTEVCEQHTLLRLLRYVGATEPEIDQVNDCIRRWGQGSVEIDLIPGRKNLLQIRKPWSDELRLTR